MDGEILGVVAPVVVAMAVVVIVGKVGKVDFKAGTTVETLAFCEGSSVGGTMMSEEDVQFGSMYTTI